MNPRTNRLIVEEMERGTEQWDLPLLASISHTHDCNINKNLLAAIITATDTIKVSTYQLSAPSVSDVTRHHSVK